ncbi:MAG: UDP-N-acetylmuramoyl-L-alanine--D-glutamate ligase [Oscillospiraceae bacterium]
MRSTIKEFLASIKGKRVAVIGIGVSNTPLIRMLLRAGISVTACDKNDRIQFGDLAEELESLGATLQMGEDYLQNLNQDIVFRTPGMRPDHPALLKAAAGGSVVTSEMEVFFDVCPCPIIAVTGSDGKTTTATIIAKLLEQAGITTYLGGNIGKPLLSQAGDMLPEDWVVLELSSFQLMSMKTSPDIAVATNLAPNHLDVHRSMEEYIAAKENIFLHQGRNGTLVLNYDNEITRAFAKKAKGNVVFFGRKHAPKEGVFLHGNTIFMRKGEETREILQTSRILLPGVHNIENYMAAIAAVEGLVPDQVIKTFAASFKGVEHRIELVRRRNGVAFYNDSIGTSPTRTIAGLHSFPDKVILIAGGYDKHLPFDELGKEIVAHVKVLVLNGTTAPSIRAAVEQAPGYQTGTPEIIDCRNFEAAVYAAEAAAKDGDVVLFSPACAAFDQFKNFAERGAAFKKMIYEL